MHVIEHVPELWRPAVAQARSTLLVAGQLGMLAPAMADAAERTAQLWAEGASERGRENAKARVSAAQVGGSEDTEEGGDTAPVRGGQNRAWRAK
eukprot:3675589-Pyramimonas_sp.AAC.1